MLYYSEVLPLCLDCAAAIHKGRMSLHKVNLLGLSQERQDIERYNPTRLKEKKTNKQTNKKKEVEAEHINEEKNN